MNAKDYRAMDGQARQKEMTDMLREQMSAAEQLAVPLKVDIGTGSNWGEAH